MSSDDAGLALRRSPLHAEHERLGASFAPFAGWLLPLRFSSELEEHRATRTAAGLFDLSHMGEIVVEGAGAALALDVALTGRLSAIAPGRARYTMICADDGGVIDDLIVYRQTEDRFLVIANAGNAAEVAESLAQRCAHYGASAVDRSDEWALIALQGPQAAGVLEPFVGPQLSSIRPYRFAPLEFSGSPVIVARTGYTGEDGYELLVPVADAPACWRSLVDAPAGVVHPAGLAARDSLRLEAGLPLYGHELTRETTPFDAGLDRFVDLDKPVTFVGEEAMVARRERPALGRLVGLVGTGPRSPRSGYGVTTPDGQRIGTVTSGCPSPTLHRPIAMAYVDPAYTEPGRALAVDVRGRLEPVEVTLLPFYRRATA